MGRLTRWIWVFFLLWPVLLAAVEVVDGPRVELAGDSAVVRWKLDVPAGGTVRFGVAEGALNRSAKSPGVAREHEVRISGLQPGARIFYSVETARKPLKSGSFVAAGSSVEPGKKGRLTPTPAADPAPNRPRPAPASPATDAAPPARRTWANVATLRDHFDRHGGDFGATSPEDYAAQAWRFLQDAKAAGWPAKLDAEGTLRVWDPRTRAFAAYTRQGMTKTYFKPGSHDYFERQPGRPIHLSADAVNDRP